MARKQLLALALVLLGVFSASPVRAQTSGAPVITVQPQAAAVPMGGNTNFSVTASSSTPMTYQWRLNGFNLPGGTDSTLNLYDVLPSSRAEQGVYDQYDVVVANSAGSTVSKSAPLIVQLPVVIASQPQSQNVQLGQSVMFMVSAMGDAPLYYQWRFNGVPLTDTNANGTNYPITRAQFANAGAYDVVITNGSGGTTSQVATLQVQATNTPTIYAPSNVVATCTSPAGAVVTFAVRVIDRYAPSPSLTVVPPSGSQFPMGTTQVTCTAVDSLGNSNTVFFTVQVMGSCDEGCIQITCPGDIQATLGNVAAVPVQFNVTGTNVCTGQACPVLCSPPSGTAFPLGTNLVACVASAGGSSKGCSFNVIVTGPAPPVLTTPAFIEVPVQGTNAASQPGATVNYQVTASDSANLKIAISNYPPSGSFFVMGTNTVNCVATDPLGNSTTKSFEIIVDPPVICTGENWGFECGFAGWEPSGTAFAYPPVTGDLLTVKRIPMLVSQIETNVGGDYWQDVFYPVGHKGQRWVCTANVPEWNAGGGPSDDLFSEALLGTLVSKQFVIQHPYITFLIGGQKDAVNLRVEFLTDMVPGTPTVTIDGTVYSIIDFRTGDGQELMRRDWFDASAFMGKNARVRIMDNSRVGHLNVDDFQFQDVAPSSQLVSVGLKQYPAVVQYLGEYYDWDAPVWGFVDMHAHPMSNLGFGQKLIHGQPDGGSSDPTNIGIGLDNCNCDHGGWGLDNTCGDYFRQLLVGGTDDGGPDPHQEGWDSNPLKEFRKWPVFSSLTHQQMWYDWMRRTYNGGERVIVALAVNNRLLATASKGVPGAPHDDQTVADLQIGELKNFVGRHSDFLEIAYDPFQLRDIVRRNKLAIVIGTEIDDIGDFARNPLIQPYNIGGRLDQYSRQAVQTEIQRLYSEGVRYVFTVHLADNKFGGTPAVNDMLNIGSKFLNGQALSVENAPPSDNIQFWLSDLDFTQYISGSEQAALTAALLLGGPLIPLIEPVIESIVPGLALVPPGTGGAMIAPLLPLVTIAVIGAEIDPNGMLNLLLGVAGVDASDAHDIVNANLLPLPGNYPHYPDKTAAPYGVRNARGLTDLGAFAVQEMMKLGIMLDVDHMSEHTLDAVMNIATNVPGGYPLNSGHNSFREMVLAPAENHRTPAQLEQIRQLGGLMGVGWENAKDGSFTRAFSDIIPAPQFSTSHVANDCAGTSKSWAQFYLYALEKLHGRNVAFGTDADGMIQFPGPRYGGQSAYGLEQNNVGLRPAQIEAQGAAAPDGVAYTPTYGHPLLTAAFTGRGVDPGGETDPPHHSQGYEYNKAQATFFAAIPIFYWEIANMFAGETQDQVNSDLEAYENALSGDNPNTRHTKEYAFGMVDGYMGWNTGSDFFDGDVGTCQQLGKSIYLSQIAHTAPLSDVLNDSGKLARYQDLLVVWNHFQRALGPNTPMIRCQTDFKQWDVNFEGVAHYGLLPDFLQDLSNVGVQPRDMSVLFHSAEGFAEMWTRAQTASAYFVPQFYGPVQPDGAGGLVFTFTRGDQQASVQENGDVTNPSGWVPATVTQYITNRISVSFRVPANNHVRFYRLLVQ